MISSSAWTANNSWWHNENASHICVFVMQTILITKDYNLKKLDYSVNHRIGTKNILLAFRKRFIFYHKQPPLISVAI